MRTDQLSKQTTFPLSVHHHSSAFVLACFVATALITLGAITEPVLLIAPAVIILAFLSVGFIGSIGEGRGFSVLALLAFSAFILEAVFRVREYTDKSLDWQVLLKAGSLLGLFAVATYRIQATYEAVVDPTRIMWFIFFLWICFTCLYAPNITYGIFGAFSLLAFYLFLLCMFRTFDEIHIILAIIAGTFAFCLTSVLVYYGLPEFGRMKEWHGDIQVAGNRLSGIGGNANTVGRQAAMTLLLLVLYAKQLKQINRFIIPVVGIVAIAALLLSNSRTSMALLLIILWFLIFCNKERIGLFLLSVTAALLLLPFVLFSGEALLAAVSRSGDISEITTGTGRTYIWAVVVQLIAERPFAGWGYGSTLFLLPEYAGDIRHIAPHAHNMILQILVTSGIIGLFFFTAAFCVRMFDAFRARNRTVLTLMAFVFLNGLTEASAFAGVANSATLAMLIAIALPLQTSHTSRLIPQGIVSRETP